MGQRLKWNTHFPRLILFYDRFVQHQMGGGEIFVLSQNGNVCTICLLITLVAHTAVLIIPLSKSKRHAELLAEVSQPCHIETSCDSLSNNNKHLVNDLQSIWRKKKKNETWITRDYIFHLGILSYLNKREISLYSKDLSKKKNKFWVHQLTKYVFVSFY